MPGKQRQRPDDARRLDRHARNGEQERHDRTRHASLERPAPRGESGQRVIGRHGQIGVSGKRNVHVGERKRRREPRADRRCKRIETAHPQRAVHRDRERDAGEPPRQVHQRIVPATERQARPHLPQRHGGRIVRRGIEPQCAVRSEPRVGATERDHVSERIPDARLRCPLNPRVPWIERRPHDVEQQRREAQHEPGSEQVHQYTFGSRKCRCGAFSGSECERHSRTPACGAPPLPPPNEQCGGDQNGQPDAEQRKRDAAKATPHASRR